MELRKVIIATKMTGLQYFIHTNNLSSVRDAVVLLTERKVNPERLIKSHYRQMEELDTLCQVFSKNKIPYTLIPRGNLTKELTEDCDLVISFGGDNHFIYVAHFSSCPILPINSDPQTSAGYLLQSQKAPKIIEALTTDHFHIQRWPKLNINLDGKPIESAVQEILFLERDSWRSSHNTISWETGGTRASTVHRGSGTILCNGVGASGWYKNAGGKYHSEPTMREVFLLAREQFSKLKEYQDGRFEGDWTIFKVTSNNDTDGVLVVDCLDEFKYPFMAGSAAEVELSMRNSNETQVIHLDIF